MLLDDLPAELLHAICEVCPKDTLHSLRLTCRQLCQAADKHFFPEVVTCLELEDLANVRKIVDCNGDIRNAVKSFVMQADRLDVNLDEEHVSRREWYGNRNLFLMTSCAEEQISEMREQLIARFSELQEQSFERGHVPRARHADALAHFLSQSRAQRKDKSLRKQNYEAYKELLVEERTLLDTPYSLTRDPASRDELCPARDTFNKLFKACPNISAITMNYKHTLRRNVGLSNLSFLRSCTIPHGGDIEEVVEQLLPAACEANLKIRDLAITGASPYWMNPGIPFSSLPGPRAKAVHKYYQVLQHVQRLQLVFNGADAQPDDWDPNIMSGFHFVTDTFADGVLIDWLKHCLEVKELRLRMPIAPFVNERVGLKDVLGDLHLKNLVLLQVSNIQAKSEELVRCLLQHKDTLRELDLATVHFYSGDWPACISSFAGKLPHLRRAKMNGILTSETGDEHEGMTTCFLTVRQAKEHQAELEKYILEGTGPMPTWPTTVNRSTMKRTRTKMTMEQKMMKKVLGKTMIQKIAMQALIDWKDGADGDVKSNERIPSIERSTRADFSKLQPADLPTDGAGSSCSLRYLEAVEVSLSMGSSSFENGSKEHDYRRFQRHRCKGYLKMKTVDPML